VHELGSVFVSDIALFLIFFSFHEFPNVLEMVSLFHVLCRVIIMEAN